MLMNVTDAKTLPEQAVGHYKDMLVFLSSDDSYRFLNKIKSDPCVGCGNAPNCNPIMKCEEKGRHLAQLRKKDI